MARNAAAGGVGHSYFGVKNSLFSHVDGIHALAVCGVSSGSPLAVVHSPTWNSQRMAGLQSCGGSVFAGGNTYDTNEYVLCGEVLDPPATKSQKYQVTFFFN